MTDITWKQSFQIVLGGLTAGIILGSFNQLSGDLVLRRTPDTKTLGAMEMGAAGGAFVALPLLLCAGLIAVCGPETSDAKEILIAHENNSNNENNTRLDNITWGLGTLATVTHTVFGLGAAAVGWYVLGGGRIAGSTKDHPIMVRDTLAASGAGSAVLAVASAGFFGVRKLVQYCRSGDRSNSSPP